MLTQELLKKLHQTKRPEALAVARIPSLAPGFLGRDQILMLEGVHELFTLGTILRCAEAFGTKEVLSIIQNTTTCLFSRTTIRSSMGAIFRVKVSGMESAAAAI